MPFVASLDCKTYYNLPPNCVCNDKCVQLKGQQELTSSSPHAQRQLHSGKNIVVGKGLIVCQEIEVLPASTESLLMYGFPLDIFLQVRSTCERLRSECLYAHYPCAPGQLNLKGPKKVSQTCLHGLKVSNSIKDEGQLVDKFKEVLRGGGLYDGEAHARAVTE